MSGTPTLFLKDRVLCRCRNSEEAKQKRMEKRQLWWFKSPNTFSRFPSCAPPTGSHSSLLAAAKRSKPVSSDPLPAHLSGMFFLQQPAPAYTQLTASSPSSSCLPQPSLAAAATPKQSCLRDTAMPPCADPGFREEAGIGGTEGACAELTVGKGDEFLAGDVQVNSGMLPERAGASLPQTAIFGTSRYLKFI